METIEEKVAYLKQVAQENGDDLMSVVYWLETLPIEWTEEDRKLTEAIKKAGSH